MPQNKDRVILPGLSFIPDPIVLQEKESLQRKLSFEFTDFLECLTDLLSLLQALKVKHLTTMFPIPFEVIREIRSETKTGIKQRTYMKSFEKNLKTSSIGCSRSVQCLLTSSSRSFGLGHQAQLLLQQQRRKTNSHGSTKKPPRNEDQQVLNMLAGGKKPPPLWHKLAKEKFITVAMVEEEERQKEKKQMKRLMGSINPSKINASISSKATSLVSQKGSKDSFSLKFATDSRPRQPDQQQKDLMNAYEAGFTSIETHRNFVNTLEPFWYANLVKDSIKSGLQQNKDISKCFHKLATFFEINCTSIPQPRAKLCIILHSLPIWDVMRLNMQRAAEYILRHIFLVPNPDLQLEEWLHARKIPYCVVPPKIERHDSDQSDDDQ